MARVWRRRRRSVSTVGLGIFLAAVVCSGNARATSSPTSTASCLALLAGTDAPSNPRLEPVWRAMTGDHGDQGLDFLMARAAPLARDLTARERIELTEFCLSHPEGQRYWMTRFLFEHVLKTRVEDPIHGLAGGELFALFRRFGIEPSAMLATHHARFFPVLTDAQLLELTEIYIQCCQAKRKVV